MFIATGDHFHQTDQYCLHMSAMAEKAVLHSKWSMGLLTNSNIYLAVDRFQILRLLRVADMCGDVADDFFVAFLTVCRPVDLIL